MKLRTLVNIIFFINVCLLNGQQISIYNQYRLNEFLLNPAIAGYDGYTSVNLTAREQWIGVKNSPQVNSVSFQTRFLKRSFEVKTRTIRKNVLRKNRKGRVGIGGFIYNDKNGLISKTGGQFSYAYHIFIDNSQLSFGLAAYLYQFDIDEDQLKFHEIDNVAMALASENAYIPDFGVGINYTTHRYMVGFSATQLLSSRIKINSELQNITERRFNFVSRYRHSINTRWETEPYMIVRTPDNLLLSDNLKKLRAQFDFFNTFIYRRDYWFGAGFRTISNSAIVSMGIRYDLVYFGYSFDYAFSPLLTKTYGSHEFMVALKFGDNIRRYRWLERY